MSSDASDPKFQRLFAASRAEDARLAPAFGEIASGRRAAPRTAIRWMRVAAAAAIVVLGASFSWLHRPAATAPFDSAGSVAAVELKHWAAVSAWRAPTDSLLTSSMPSWGGSLSAPTDQLINAVSGETDSTSNNGKEAL